MRMYPHIYVMQGEVCKPKWVGIRFLSENHAVASPAQGEPGLANRGTSGYVGEDEGRVDHASELNEMGRYG